MEDCGRAVSAKADHPPESGIDSSIAGISWTRRVGVRYLPSVSDALNYADDFSTIFKAINWTVVPAEPAEDFPCSSSGLAIVACEEKLPASAEALRDALRIYGIEAQVVRDSSNLCGPSNFASNFAWWSQSPEARLLFAGTLRLYFFFCRGDFDALALNVQSQPGKYTHINIGHPHQSETGN